MLDQVIHRISLDLSPLNFLIDCNIDMRFFDNGHVKIFLYNDRRKMLKLKQFNYQKIINFRWKWKTHHKKNYLANNKTCLFELDRLKFHEKFGYLLS